MVISLLATNIVVSLTLIAWKTFGFIYPFRAQNPRNSYCVCMALTFHFVPKLAIIYVVFTWHHWYIFTWLYLFMLSSRGLIYLYCSYMVLFIHFLACPYLSKSSSHVLSYQRSYIYQCHIHMSMSIYVLTFYSCRVHTSLVIYVLIFIHAIFSCR